MKAVTVLGFTIVSAIEVANRNIRKIKVSENDGSEIHTVSQIDIRPMTNCLNNC